jgi:hypothetical protein
MHQTSCIKIIDGCCPKIIPIDNAAGPTWPTLQSIPRHMNVDITEIRHERATTIFIKQTKRDSDHSGNLS